MDAYVHPKGNTKRRWQQHLLPLIANELSIKALFLEQMLLHVARHEFVPVYLYRLEACSPSGRQSHLIDHPSSAALQIAAIKRAHPVRNTKCKRSFQSSPHMTLTSSQPSTTQQSPSIQQQHLITGTIAPILPSRKENLKVSNLGVKDNLRTIQKPAYIVERPYSNNSDTKEMDLADWRFDPSMLTSLIGGDNNADSASEKGKKRRTESKATSSSRSSPTRLDSNNWDGNLTLLSNFGGLEYERGGSAQRSNVGDDGEASQPIQTFDSEGSERISERSKKEGGAVSVASRATAETSNLSQNNFGDAQLHPMAIQSSATCPPHSSSSSRSSVAECSSGSGSNPHLQLAGAGLMPGQIPQANSDFYALHGIDSAAIQSLAASFQNTTGSNGGHLNSLAANFLLAQQGPSETSEATVQNYQQQQHPPAAASVSASSSSGSKAPPFYLFDAPVELRANFMQNQKRLGLPIQHDPNSYHYGETVKGFHPQQLLNQQQLTAMATSGQVNRIPEVPVRLIDARHGYKANVSGRVKNEREQKRAQKITELIDQLRIDMEKGGWKVEMRSKFHTLSQ